MKDIVNSNNEKYKLPKLEFSGLDDMLFNNKKLDEEYPYFIEVIKLFNFRNIL